MAAGPRDRLRSLAARIMTRTSMSLFAGALEVEEGNLTVSKEKKVEEESERIPMVKMRQEE